MTVPGSNGPSLREYLERLFSEHEARHDDHQAAHDREHKFAQDAIDKAASLGKENKADANEWRAAMNDREKQFPTRVELGTVDQRVQKLEDAEIARVTSETLRREKEADEKRDSERRVTTQIAVISVGMGVLVFLANLALRLATGSP